MCIEARNNLPGCKLDSFGARLVPDRNLAAQIRWQMATAQSAEFLRSLPMFKVQPLPRTFVDLLQRLEDEEDKAEGNGGA